MGGRFGLCQSSGQPQFTQEMGSNHVLGAMDGCGFRGWFDHQVKVGEALEYSRLLSIFE